MWADPGRASLGVEMSIAQPVTPEPRWSWRSREGVTPSAEPVQVRAARAAMVAEGILVPLAAVTLLLAVGSVSGFLGLVAFFDGPGLAWVLVAILLGGTLEWAATMLGRHPLGWWGAVTVHSALPLSALGFIQWAGVAGYPMVAADLVLQWLVLPAFVLGLLATPALRRAGLSRPGKAG